MYEMCVWEGGRRKRKELQDLFECNGRGGIEPIEDGD